MGGGSGGGSGGGGTSTTTSEASYAPEFRPLADAAREQIIALQKKLPLAGFSDFSPAGVAGLSPVQQFAINELVMRTPNLPASFQSLMELPAPIGAASKGAVKAGEGSRGAAGALDYLSELLGRDVRPAPASTAPFQVLTRFPTPETAFPGLTFAALEAVRPNIALATPIINPRDALALEVLRSMGVVPPPGVPPVPVLEAILAPPVPAPPVPDPLFNRYGISVSDPSSSGGYPTD